MAWGINKATNPLHGFTQLWKISCCELSNYSFGFRHDSIGSSTRYCFGAIRAQGTGEREWSQMKTLVRYLFTAKYLSEVAPVPLKSLIIISTIASVSAEKGEAIIRASRTIPLIVIFSLLYTHDPSFSFR